MAEFLIKYLKSDGSTRVSDPSLDSFEMKTIFLDGFEFTKDNIALVSDQNFVSGFVDDLNTRFLTHENQQQVYENENNLYVSAAFDLSRSIADEINYQLNSYAVQERIFATSGQTDFSVSGFTWNPTDPDILVFKNGLHQVQSVSGEYDYWKISENEIRFAYPMNTNDRIVIRMERPVSNRVIKSFWREYIEPGATRSVPFSSRYNTGEDRLWMFKNGVYLANTRSLGDRVEQFEEGNPSFAILGTVGEPSDLITAYNMQSPPVFRFYQEVSGTVATIPTYVNGDGNLVVFKNGLLMNIGIGDINSTYTESSTTSVTFDAPVDFDDLLSFEYFPSLSWRESQIIASGTAVNFLNPYTIGDGRLMIFRNGLLMVNSLTLGTPIERYSETSVSGITLEQAASGEVFTAIYL